ncbi:MAG: ThuA domain-containing protein [Armatimonadota bacterium]
MDKTIRVTVWNEFRHEKDLNDKTSKVYPDGIHTVIAKNLSSQPGFVVQTATLDEPEHGLTEEVLKNTDVLIWWAHMAHHEVSDEIVERVHQRIITDGMGLIVLHSGHFSKIFKKLMGTGCDLKWREVGEKERIWVIDRAHPIAEGLPDYFELPQTEMYGEPFGIPSPDELVFISWFQGGEVFRSGCCWHRGMGKVFYFRPGHETYPIFFNETVMKVISNGIKWAAPTCGPAFIQGERKPLEKLG